MKEQENSDAGCFLIIALICIFCGIGMLWGFAGALIGFGVSLFVIAVLGSIKL